MSTTWLIDKSAIVRLATTVEAEIWSERIERGLVHVTTLTLLEVGYSARSEPEHAAMLGSSPLACMPVDYMSPAIEERALAVQSILAIRGHHRAPSIPDLLIAAAAELHRRTVLHVDKDFDMISGVTGQPVQRLPIA